MPVPSPASTWKCPRTTWVPVLAWVVLASLAARAKGQEVDRLEIGGATINVAFDAAPAPAFRQLTLDWITRAANAVTVYYTAFPVHHVDIAVHVIKGASVRHGTASGEGGAHVTVTLGSEVTARALAEGNDNWLMTHEMVHLALSGVEVRHHWLEEGLATYVEPIARVRSGELDAHQVWHDMVEGMPNGEPAKGDAGLDRTPTWGRTYWGGALFCLLADVEIRKQTGNQKGLEDALRAIVASGGTIETDWGISRVLDIGDKAIGLPVLVPLYDRMKDDPSPVDLKSLWQQLGVEEQGNTVVFHEQSPLAAIRKAITQR
jgi:hypothetical protein